MKELKESEAPPMMDRTTSRWKEFAVCDECGYTTDWMLFSAEYSICPKCGAEAGDFNEFHVWRCKIGRRVNEWSGVWWKPWTWRSREYIEWKDEIDGRDEG